MNNLLCVSDGMFNPTVRLQINRFLSYFILGRGADKATPTAIVVTDGNSNIDPDRTIIEALEAQADGIQIFAVGM